MSARRPLLSLGLDLDNLWSYMKIHGDAGWDAYPSYLEKLTPLLLDSTRRAGVKMTVFVVGQDAALEKNHASLSALSKAGFEIGNHSFRHEPWFHLYSRSEIEEELRRSEDAIEKATGRRPIGFRGPGFSLSNDTLRVLAGRRYLYDCSTLPTFLGPLARAYYFWTAGEMTAEEREKRKKLYGTLADGFQPIHPYCWDVDGRKLVELPVTTMPGARTPFHMSYLMYLMRFSRAAAWAYFRTALALCRMTGTSPSFLLHPLDFLGGDLVKELAFFPGMDLPTKVKLEFVHEVLAAICTAYDVVTLEEHARAMERSAEVGVRRVREELAIG
jgi:peptidoglycan/xylan/chitin deacetylase (PgdA/CDA1 family)